MEEPLICIWEDMRRKREKIEEKCRFFLMVYSFCKVDISESRKKWAKRAGET